MRRLTSFAIILLITITTCVQITISSKCNSTKEAWENSLKPYPGLKEFIEIQSNTSFQVPDPETGEFSRSLEFLNWQDFTFRLKCPLPDVIEWRLHYRNGTEDEEFREAYHKSRDQILSTKAEHRFEYLRTYSCKSSSCCWHHFSVITRPYPKTSHSTVAMEGSDIQFTCGIYPYRGYEKEDRSESKYAGNGPNAPFKIHWKLPTDDIPENFNMTFEVVPGLGTISSNVSISNASISNAGVHECIATDRFHVNSTPVTRISASRDSQFSGIAHVHVRSWNYVWTALIALLVMVLILPPMIKFLPTNVKEADLEEEDVPGSQTIVRNGREGSAESNRESLLGNDSRPKSGETKLLSGKDE